MNRKDFLKEAQALGWEPTFTPKHIRWTHATAGLYFSSSTPSDRRAYLNAIKDMARLVRNATHAD